MWGLQRPQPSRLREAPRVAVRWGAAVAATVGTHHTATTATTTRRATTTISTVGVLGHGTVVRCGRLDRCREGHHVIRHGRGNRGGVHSCGVCILSCGATGSQTGRRVGLVPVPSVCHATSPESTPTATANAPTTTTTAAATGTATTPAAVLVDARVSGGEEVIDAHHVHLLHLPCPWPCSTNATTDAAASTATHAPTPAATGTTTKHAAARP